MLPGPTVHRLDSGTKVLRQSKFATNNTLVLHGLVLLRTPAQWSAADTIFNVTSL